MKRRDFIRNISILGLSAIGSGCSPLYKISAKKNNGPRIGILGAGIAGLHAAYILSNRGYNVSLFEGRNRLGGRVNTVYNLNKSGVNVETGGEFIDSNHKDMLRLAKHFDLEVVDSYLDFNDYVKDAYYFDGTIYSDTQVNSWYIEIIDKIKSDLKSCGAEYDTNSCEILDQIDLHNYVYGLNAVDSLKSLLDHAYVAEFGLSSEIQSSLNLIDLIGKKKKEFSIFGVSDERYRLAKGNSALVEKLAANISGDINLDYSVSGIKENNAGQYEVAFDNRANQIFDFLLITIPFSALRLLDLEFEMSNEKRDCINNLGYGVNNKLFLKFDERIWRNAGYSGYMFGDLIQNGWDAGHMQKQNQGSTFYTVYNGGTDSLKLENELNHDIYYDYLDLMYNKKYRGERLSEKTVWSNDPYSLGSYSCYKTGQWSNISGFEIEPVKRIYFAGEHCSDAFQGYMNGAAETGRLAALDMISKLEKKTVS